MKAKVGHFSSNNCIISDKILKFQRNQKKRIEYQRELASKIVQGIQEIDFAVDRHERIKTEKNQAREKVINNKLKPKGFRLLERKNEK